MIRELDALFDISIKEIDNKRKNKTRNYWCAVYARFLDLHEEKYVDFAHARWRVDDIANPVERVTLNSLSDGNQIYELKYTNG